MKALYEGAKRGVAPDNDFAPYFVKTALLFILLFLFE